MAMTEQQSQLPRHRFSYQYPLTHPASQVGRTFKDFNLTPLDDVSNKKPEQQQNITKAEPEKIQTTLDTDKLLRVSEIELQNPDLTFPSKHFPSPPIDTHNSPNPFWPAGERCSDTLLTRRTCPSRSCTTCH